LTISRLSGYIFKKSSPATINEKSVATLNAGDKTPAFPLFDVDRKGKPVREMT
jgi:hypothetical protein